MKRSLALKLILCLALLALCLATFAAEANPPAKASSAAVDKPVDVTFNRVPLGDAISGLFKLSGKTYTLDPALQQLKITAELKNVSFDTAIAQVLSAAGATCSVDAQGVYHISSLPQQVFQGRVPAASPAPPGNNNAMFRSQVVNTKYIGAGQAANVISGTPGVNEVQTTGGGQLIINGTQEGIDQAMQTVNAIDNDSALPRPVRLKVTAKITAVTAKGPKTYEASTESVGAEQAPSLLNLSAQSRYDTNYNTVVGKQVIRQSTPNFLTTSLLNATITPSIGSDGRISLVGRGHFSCPLSAAPGSELSKDFDVAASVVADKPFTIAAGSAHLVVGDVSFVVTITATPEQGHVPVSPSLNNQPQGGYGGVVPSASPGNYGGGYGGGNPGSYGGGAGRGW